MSSQTQETHSLYINELEEVHTYKTFITDTPLYQGNDSFASTVVPPEPLRNSSIELPLTIWKLWWMNASLELRCLIKL